MTGDDPQAIPLRMGPLQLDPQPNAGLEWWFAQGRVAGATQAFRIMVALFLVRGGDTEGALLVTHAINEATGDTHTQTRVTGGVMAIEEAMAREVARSRVPAWLPGLLPLALWRHRADHARLKSRSPEYREDDRGLRYEPNPLVISWSGMLLGHDPRSNTLRLTLPVAPGRGLEARIALPDHVMDVGSDRLSADYGPGFWYQCAPALPLSGRIGTEEVTGQIWLDRQWGEMEGWLVAPAKRGQDLLGWDWFALTLGPEWQIMLNRHHLRPDGQDRGGFALLFDQGQPLALPGGFVATPLDHWDSPRSGARYPVRWSLEVPDLNAAFALEPLTHDQEIPLPGGLSIWEGAMNFEGHMAGHPITGTARGEFTGYAAILSVAERIRRRMVAGF